MRYLIQTPKLHPPTYLYILTVNIIVCSMEFTMRIHIKYNETDFENYFLESQTLKSSRGKVGWCVFKNKKSLLDESGDSATV